GSAPTWNPNGIPTTGDGVIINSGHAITLDGNRTVAQLTFNPLIPLSPPTANISAPMSLSSGTGGPFTLTVPVVQMTGAVGLKGDYYIGSGSNSSTLVTQ